MEMKSLPLDCGNSMDRSPKKDKKLKWLSDHLTSFQLIDQKLSDLWFMIF